MEAPQHIPVLLDVVLEVLHPSAKESVLDVTLGLGGHSLAFLKRVGPDGSLTAIDADTVNIAEAKNRIGEPSNVTYIHANFADLPSLDVGTFDIIFADLGVSSPHFDDASRGFTFREDAALDMRYNRESGMTAAELIEQSTEEELANILFTYGELRQSRKLAQHCKQANPTTTFQLKAAVEAVVGYRAASLLPQVFQALRIVVNRELEAVETLLDFAPTALNENGRIGILTYHSLEDRLVKKAFKALTTAEVDDYTGQDKEPAPFIQLTKKPIAPSQEELERNPRSRSAKLRAIQKRNSA